MLLRQEVLKQRASRVQVGSLDVFSLLKVSDTRNTRTSFGERLRELYGSLSEAVRRVGSVRVSQNVVIFILIPAVLLAIGSFKLLLSDRGLLLRNTPGSAPISGNHDHGSCIAP